MRFLQIEREKCEVFSQSYDSVSIVHNGFGLLYSKNDFSFTLNSCGWTDLDLETNRFQMLRSRAVKRLLWIVGKSTNQLYLNPNNSKMTSDWSISHEALKFQYRAIKKTPKPSLFRKFHTSRLNNQCFSILT